jgi:hypothetical protein
VTSRSLVLYTQQTGKVVIKEHDRTRQIELRARISKRLLGQERLPLGINRHLSEHIPIPTRDQFAKQPNRGGWSRRFESARRCREEGHDGPARTRACQVGEPDLRRHFASAPMAHLRPGRTRTLLSLIRPLLGNSGRQGRALG